MAKWGEGDPRWIVEERPDATNVNNWHWTEKNADSWSQKKLRELFVNSVIEDDKIGNVVIEEMEKCEGEARANNRKAKLIFFYEWIMVLKWKGHLNGSDKEVNGKIEIPNLSEEHTDMKDVDVDVSVSTKGKESEVLKEMLRKGKGAQEIRKRLGQYVESLKSEFSQGLILPNKDNNTVVSNKTMTSSASATKINASSSSSSSSVNAKMTNLDLGCPLRVEELKMEESFKCTGQELFNALTQKQMIQVFTCSAAEMPDEAEVGKSFQLLGGNIQGEFKEIVPFTKIVQKWRLKSWPSAHYANVVINIKQTKDDTKLTLTASGVPLKELENTKQGWRRYYWESIKRCFGYGSVLF